MSVIVSKTALINRALARLGSAPIAALDEESSLARQCNAIYDDLLDALFGLHDWSFARRTVALDRAAVDPINGWGYAFVLPGERLSAPLKVLRDPKDPDRPLRDYALEEGFLYADAPALWAAFTWRVDPSTWDTAPVFRAAFLSGLAAWLALPVAQNSTLREEYWVEAFGTPREDMRGGLVGKAIQRDVHGAPGAAVAIQDPLTAARFA